MSHLTTRASEKANVAILAISQALFLITSVTVMTISGVVGQMLTAMPALATLPVAAMMIGTLVSTLPASLLMKRIGRRPGFIIGTLLGGGVGGAVSVLGVVVHSFWMFCAGNLLIGVYQGFAMYYRFAAADVASESFRSRAISLVMAGGVIAAFLGPWNVRFSASLFPALPQAGAYVVVTLLALLSALLMTQLKVPAAAEPDGVEPARALSRIAGQFAFLIAVASATIGYTVMVLVMTATPLAMRAVGLEMGAVTMVMQAHVLGMFLPSFVTGNLIARFGVVAIILSGSALMAGAALTAMMGSSLAYFLIALVLLGTGWNFMFIGGSALLTRTHTLAERGLVQGVNDLLMFSFVAAGSLMGGVLFHQLGWWALNVFMIPLVGIVAVGAICMHLIHCPEGRGGIAASD